ncbi:hypothetical protein MtrunA17_Chr4g0023481 [Medicago truncatula]|uniref:Transmembrane protein n=1 Tax=Medicago truncatula TaxID=3880 RepID=A0A396I3R4_MEDTR|nr:hypothetical protein MtrunA17_Chr4g0023481 [Medicago truncatula]
MLLNIIVEIICLILLFCEISPLLLGNVALRMSNLQVIESRLLCLLSCVAIPH